MFGNEDFYRRFLKESTKSCLCTVSVFLHVLSPSGIYLTAGGHFSFCLTTTAKIGADCLSNTASRATLLGDLALQFSFREKEHYQRMLEPGECVRFFGKFLTIIF